MSRLEEILAELQLLDFPIEKRVPGNIFSLPERYFNDFPQDMLALAKAEAHQEEITQSFSRLNPFHIPKNYFENFPEQLLDQIGEENEETREELPIALSNKNLKRNPYPVPEHYFRNFEIQLRSQLQLSANRPEPETLSSLLTSLRNKKTFEVPEGYFEQPQAKVIKLPRTAERSIRWTRWVAAAAIIFIFGLGGWNFLTPAGEYSQSFNVQEALSQIPDEDIQEYLNYALTDYEASTLAKNGSLQTQVPDPALFKEVSDREIKEYLEYGTY